MKLQGSTAHMTQCTLSGNNAAGVRYCSLLGIDRNAEGSMVLQFECTGRRRHEFSIKQQCLHDAVHAERQPSVGGT